MTSSRLHTTRKRQHLLWLLLTLFLLSPAAFAQQADTTIFGWSSRKLTGVVLSTIIPGAGQSYMGHDTKGAVFTIGFFGSGLMAVLTENNIIGRNERLDELKALYATSTTWLYSNELWLQMVETKSILDRDVKRRDIFLKIAVAFWVASVADAVFLSDDLGASTFGATLVPSINVATLPGTQEPVISARFSYHF